MRGCYRGPFGTIRKCGLVGSLREEVGRLQHEAPALTVTLDAPDEDLADLPAAVEVACYRIVTEALTTGQPPVPGVYQRQYSSL